jgi:hypothetical protein
MADVQFLLSLECNSKIIVGFEPSVCEVQGGEPSLRECDDDQYQAKQTLSSEMRGCNFLETCSEGLFCCCVQFKVDLRSFILEHNLYLIVYH